MIDEAITNSRPDKNGTDMKALLATFSRAQLAAIGATLLDYGVLFLCTEILHVWYVASTALGALLGAVANFLINRHWSFKASEGSVKRQARRYTLVSGGSLLLNTMGVWAVTEFIHIHYALSVIVISIIVAVFFNYPMQHGYVYRM